MTWRFSRTFRLLPSVTVLLISAACSSELTSPSHRASGLVPELSSNASQNGPKGPRKKDHRFKSDDGGDMYIDIAASVLHDGNGHEARLGKEARVALEGIFDSWEVRHTQIDELMADHDFQKCLKAAIKNQIKVTIERKVVPQPQSGSPTLTTDVTLRSLGGAPSPQRPAFDISTPPDDDWVPTFCQAASMGLYQANQLYRSAGGAFKKALRDAIAEGVVIDGSTWAYSGTEVFGVTTTLAIETAAYSLYQTYAILGFWAYQMRSGGCLNVGAQYGWVSPTSSAAGCHYENITLSWGARIPIAPPSVREAKSPNSRPNFEYWTGIVLVCG